MAATGSTSTTLAAGVPEAKQRDASRSAWSRTQLARLLPSPTATPLASAMTVLLIVAAVALHVFPGDVNAVVAWTSTNTHNLAEHPVAAMLLSVFVVAGNPLPNLAIVAVGFAVLERAVGPWRTALIALSGQVVATLLTEYGAALVAHWRLIDAAPADRPDVGVSYVMYAVLAAAVMTMSKPARLAGLLILGAAVIGPLVTTPGMTPTGHVLSVAIGAVVMTGHLRRGGEKGRAPAG